MAYLSLLAYPKHKSLVLTCILRMYCCQTAWKFLVRLMIFQSVVVWDERNIKYFFHSGTCCIVKFTCFVDFSTKYSGTSVFSINWFLGVGLKPKQYFPGAMVTND